MNAIAAPGRFLKMSEVVRETSLHRATIYRRIERGEFPKAVCLGGRRVAWREADIERWKTNPEAEQY
ncbi:helix-turn-helix transcriptional regulator [Novosphingopyxis sp. YJ-S2-01]|uniref:helix-turn-helix transcriptional regulator n=1 Tax=Novosphingopyxis sp. YJ-S2-01 TaxID=2794021 RepID=UPI001E62911A|nr:AlpA family phage regulatory protein [Novosphingopyxis sp. YJ-S2-01]